MIPASTRRVEDLPAPLRPTMPTVSPRLDVQRDVAQRVHRRRARRALAADEQLLECPPAVGAHAERAPGVLQDDLARRGAAHTTTASSRLQAAEERRARPAATSAATAM